MKSALLGVVAAALLGSATACIGIFSPTEPIILGVSEIEAPASISPGTPLTVALNVELGGCKRFDRIETERSATGASVTVWGRTRTGRGTVCTTDIRFESHSVRFDPPFTSTFTLSVHRGRMPPHQVVVRVE